LFSLSAVGTKKAGPAVTVAAHSHRAERAAERPAQSCRNRHVGKFSAVEISVEMIGLRTVNVWPAVVRLAGVAEARHVSLQGVVQIIADKQIDKAVSIEIKETCRHTPRIRIVGAADC